MISNVHRQLNSLYLYLNFIMMTCKITDHKLIHRIEIKIINIYTEKINFIVWRTLKENLFNRSKVGKIFLQGAKKSEYLKKPFSSLGVKKWMA